MNVVDKFAALFQGLKRAYGTYEIEEEKDGKKVGSARTIVGKYDSNNWKSHLNGHIGLGIIPIMDDNTVSWGVIDVDRYDLNPKEFSCSIHTLPFVMCRSKSGGLHIFLFTKETVPASLMKNKLTEAAGTLGFGGCEVFPKQTKIIASKGDLANWLNMPYFNAKDTERYCIANGTILSVEEFIEYAYSKRITKKELEKFSVPVGGQSDIFPDGPPCINYLAKLSFPKGSRNNGLFGIGVYLRKSDTENWETVLNECNKKYMKPPLNVSEVKMVVKSLNKKVYNYKCTDQPCVSHCDRALCLTRAYGITDESNHVIPVVSSIIKFLTDPPIYFLDVNGRRIGPVIIDELIVPFRFQRLCAQELNTMIPTMKRTDWDGMWNRLMENVVNVDVPFEDSNKGQLMQRLNEFCTGQKMTSNIDQILVGRVYYNEELLEYWFRGRDFLDYISTQSFKGLDPNEIYSILKNYGLTNNTIQVKETTLNVWVYKPTIITTPVAPHMEPEHPY